MCPATSATSHDKRVYLDGATAMPLHPAAKASIQAATADGWSDPARLYREARQARQLLDAATAVFAEILHIRPDNITFYGSGTQAVHAAVLGGLAARKRVGSTFLHSTIEHSAVLKAASWHNDNANGRSIAIDVDHNGLVDIAAFTNAVEKPRVALAALMAANHEVGTIQPTAELANACQRADVPLYVDASAALGWIPIEPGWSLLSASARKWGGPAGVGVMAVTPGTRWRSPWPTDESQHGRGVGALNIPAVVAAAAALRARLTQRAQMASRLTRLIDRIREGVTTRLNDVQVVGHPHLRLPHIVTFSALYLDGESLVHELDRRGFSVSSGSACTASTVLPSHVLTAMGVITHGNIRVALSDTVTDTDVERFLAALIDIVTTLRGNQP